MSKRYYLCDVIGDGQSEETSYRPAVAGIEGAQWVWDMPTDAQGQPVQTWGLTLVAARNHAPLRSVQGVDPMPDVSLDVRVSAIEAGAKAAMKAAMTRRGLNANAIVDGTDGYREVIRAVGQVANPAFDENALDITDV